MPVINKKQAERITTYVDQMYLRNILFPRKSVTAIIGVGKELVREIE